MRPLALVPLLMLACTADGDKSGPAGGDSGSPSTGDSGTTDSPPITTGACAAPPEGVDLGKENAGFLFTEGAVAPTVFAFCIGLDADAQAALATSPEIYTEGTLSFGGESWTVGVRLKGSESGSFRTLEEKASFKIKMHEYDPDQRFHGRKRLTFNSMIQDGSMVSEHAAYYLFDAVGVPSPRHGYAQVWVNDELFGLYGVVESMDDEFLERAFADAPDGNLYEGGYGADLYAHRAENFDVKETIGEEEDRTDLEALIDAVEASADGDGDTLGLLDTWFERDALLAMWATELVISDQDAYTTLANNFMLYHPTEDGRWWMTPWGPDQSFWRYETADVIDVTGELDGRIAADCRADPDCSAALDAKIEEVLAVWDSVDLAGYVDLTTRAIETACRADPRSSWGEYGCLDAQEATRQWVLDRPDVVRAQLGG